MVQWYHFFTHGNVGAEDVEFSSDNLELSGRPFRIRHNLKIDCRYL